MESDLSVSHYPSTIFWSHTTDMSVTPRLLGDYLSTSDLSADAITILHSFDSIFASYDFSDSISLGTFVSSVDNLFDSSMTLSSSTERFLIGSCLSVAKNSAQYWFHNLDKWEDFGALKSGNTLSNSPTDRNSRAKTIIAGDIIAACSTIGAEAAAAIAMVVLSGPPGWGVGATIAACCGIAVAAAAAGSCATAICIAVGLIP